MWGRKPQGYTAAEVDYAVTRGYNAGHAAGMQEQAATAAQAELQQAAMYARYKSPEDKPKVKDDDNERLRKHNKKLLERIAYYENKEA